MTTEAQIKIQGRYSLHYDGNYRRGNRSLPGHCKLCGALLTDPISIKSGFGYRCSLKVPVIIILEIPSEEDVK